MVERQGKRVWERAAHPRHTIKTLEQAVGPTPKTHNQRDILPWITTKPFGPTRLGTFTGRAAAQSSSRPFAVTSAL